MNTKNFNLRAAHRLFLIALFSVLTTTIQVFAADGDLDTTFGSGGKVTTDFNNGVDTAESVAVQVDGKIVVAGEKDADGYPKPDFSALEKWFEIVRCEYKPFERKLYVYIKPKVDGSSRPFHGFYAEFRDKDGILLQDPYFAAVSEMPGGDVAIGEMKKLEIPTPAEKALGQTAAVTIKRVVE